MKRLLLTLFVLGIAGTLHAESYRIFSISLAVGQNSANDKNSMPFLKDAASFRTAIVNGDVTVKQLFSVKLNASGAGVVDQTYHLVYPQHFDSTGKALTIDSLVVGASATLEKQKDGQINIHYSSMQVDHWFINDHGNFQPRFKTVRVDTRVPLKGDPSAPVMLGGLAGTECHLVIQRVPDSEVGP